MIEYLIRFFGDSVRVAVLSRGYRRKSSGFVLAAPHSTVEELGDEPFQIYRKFPGIAVAVDADRRNGILELQKREAPDLILLDDAFQHRRVKADLNLLLTSYDRLYVDDWYLPTGNLRDTIAQVGRAHYVIVTKCPSTLTSTEKSDIRRKLGLREGTTVLFSYLEYEDRLQSDHNVLALADLKGEQITLITGIAQPEPLVDYLKSKGVMLEHMAFADHHFFTENEVEGFRTKKLLVTTEKDYVRLKGRVSHLYYLPVRHRFFEEDGLRLRSGLEGFMMPNP